MPVPDLADFAAGPDPAHAALGRAALAAVARLADHLEQLADSFLLGQTAADFAQTVLTNFAGLQQTVTDLAGQVADLQTRVAALENPTTTATEGGV